MTRSASETRGCWNCRIQPFEAVVSEAFGGIYCRHCMAELSYPKMQVLAITDFKSRLLSSHRECITA